MNFAHNSLKLKSKAQNEDFCFDIETAQGHFFAVLDFAPHDYANLNATLKGKLETVVGSFASVSKFSPDLFLGFLAKEINNFLHHLGEQSSGPEILCSAALCLVGGNRLSHLLCGNVRIDITGGRLLSLSGALPEALEASGDTATRDEARLSTEELGQLGTEKLESPLTDRVQAFTLLDDDVVLIMTHGLEAGFDRRQLPRELVGGGSPDPKAICEALMKASASSSDDRTVVVIAGPYEQGLDPALSDLSKAIAVLEAKVNALADNDSACAASLRVSDREVGSAAQTERNAAQELEALKVELEEKAARVDLVAFDEQLKTMNALLGSKADSADLLGLKHDVSKLSKAASTNSSALEKKETQESNDHSRRPWMGWTLLLVFITAIAAGFLGAWFQSRVFKKTPEVLTNPVPVSSPAQATLTPEPATSVSSEAVIEIAVKPGDSLKKFAERYQVTQERIKELNPTITKWNTIQSGQQIKVPSSTSATPTTSPSPEQVVDQPAPIGSSGTMEVTVGPGDSLNRFAQRYNTTPAKLRELNPQITNWAQIHTGQKLLVPTPPG